MAPAQNYSDEKSKEIVAAMLNAHGSYSKWEKSSSISFSIAMYLSSLPVEGNRTYFDNWRYYKVKIDPETSRGYAYFPWSGARIGFDGETIWNKGYKHGSNFTNPPLFILYYHYSLINLPWLTQKRGTFLSYEGMGKLPNGDIQYHVIRMTFQPENRSHDGHYLLYIDTDSFLLKATKHNAFLPLLGEDLLQVDMPSNSSEIIRVYEKYTDVDGMIFPRGYTSISSNGQMMAGTHIVLNISNDKTFSADDYIKPKEAIVE